MPNFFSAGSPYLNHPLLTAERTAAEVDFLIEQIGLAEGDSILDVGCGFGRHSTELAKRGFAVVGIDPAEAMINAAREAAIKAKVDVQFGVASGESFQVETAFDAAICLFTTLGQISQNGDNRGLVANVASHLKTGGKFVVEVPQREPYIATLKPDDRFGNEQNYTQITRRYDENNQALHEHFKLVSPTETRTYDLRFQLFAQDELADLLTVSGFQDLSWFADYQANPLQPESPFMVALGSAP